jgi:hypothetical protein
LWEAIHRDPWEDHEADVLVDGRIAAKLKIRGGHTRG